MILTTGLALGLVQVPTEMPKVLPDRPQSMAVPLAQATPTNPVLHPQLQEQTFKPVIPIKYQVLDKLLLDHSNRKKIDYVVKDF